MTDYNPTAANIISSLGIKGATVDTPAPGYVPVLGPDGRLSARFIPAGTITVSLSTLSDVAYVDPYTATPAAERNGAITSPFISLEEAVAGFRLHGGAATRGCAAFMLAPGKYLDSNVDFRQLASGGVSELCLIGLGKCNFSASRVLMRLNDGVRLSIQGIVTSGTISLLCSGPEVTLLWNTEIHALSASSGMTVKIAPGARVDSTNAPTVTYLAEASKVVNDSQVVGDTVKGALDRLNARKVRVIRLSAGSSGFSEGSSYDIGAGSSGGGYDFFDMRSRDRALADGLNRLIADLRNGNFDTVTANMVIADVVKTTELQMESLVLGGYRLEVDPYGYLVVSEASDTPIRPPSATLLIRDSVTGALYYLGVSNGRMYVAKADEDGSSESSSSAGTEIIDALEIIDPYSDSRYEVIMSDGRLVIRLADSGSSSGSSSQ